MFKNFIFDLYGTLADIRTDENSPKFKSAVSRYFKELNPAISDFFAEYKMLCSLADNGKEYCEPDLFFVFKRLLNGADDKTVLTAAEFFRTKSRLKLKTYGGVKSLLKALKKACAGIYLLTNAQACFTLKELEILKISRYFNGIEISSDFGEKKPSPEFFRHLINKYALNPAECVFVGNDLKADVTGAKAAGFNTAYVKSRISPAEDSLERAKKVADFATDSFKELKKFLLSSCSACRTVGSQ